MTRHLRSSLAGFWNDMDDLILFRDGNFTNYDANARGIEIALAGNWTNGMHVRLGYTLQTTEYGDEEARLPDSPNHLLKANISAPLWRDKVLAVLAVSATKMTYRWFRGDSSVGGATESILTVPNMNRGQAGVYNVHISNASGTVVSSNATVVVVDKVAGPLPVQQARITDQGLQLSLSGLTNQQCTFFASSNLIHWDAIATNQIVGGAATYTDAGITNRPYRYYRVMGE